MTDVPVGLLVTIAVVNLTEHDVVRHPLVQSILRAYDASASDGSKDGT